MMLKVKWKFDGQTGTDIISDSELRKWIEAGPMRIVSYDITDSEKRKIQAEIEAYNRGDENAFGDARNEDMEAVF